MSTLKVNTIQEADGTIFTKVLQILQNTKTDTTSTTSNFADTGLSQTITTSSSSSKVLCIVSLGIMSAANSSFKTKLVRGSTDIFVGDSAGNRPQASGSGQTSSNFQGQQIGFSFMDSPSQGTHTYKVQFGGNTAIEIFLNRTSRDSNTTAEDARNASSLILMEISQ